MSSVYVRDQITNFITSNSVEKVVDLTGEFGELRDMLSQAGVNGQDTWIGLQFVGSEEIPVDILSTNSKGKYRESGVIYLHIVDIARLGVHNAILPRAEALRSLFRGQRIGTILIEAVSPPNFGGGVTLSFSGGYTAALVQIDYQRDLDL